MGNEVLGKGLQQGLVNGRITGSKIIHGIHKALTKKDSPNPVDDGL